MVTRPSVTKTGGTHSAGYQCLVDNGHVVHIEGISSIVRIYHRRVLHSVIVEHGDVDVVAAGSGP